jgi:hypothetical protein
MADDTAIHPGGDAARGDLGKRSRQRNGSQAYT